MSAHDQNIYPAVDFATGVFAIKYYYRDSYLMAHDVYNMAKGIWVEDNRKSGPALLKELENMFQLQMTVYSDNTTLAMIENAENTPVIFEAIGYYAKEYFDYVYSHPLPIELLATAVRWYNKDLETAKYELDSDTGFTLYTKILIVWVPRLLVSNEICTCAYRITAQIYTRHRFKHSESQLWMLVRANVLVENTTIISAFKNPASVHSFLFEQINKCLREYILQPSVIVEADDLHQSDEDDGKN